MQCMNEFTMAETNHPVAPGYFEPMMATSESDDEYSGRRQIPLSLRMSARAGVSNFEIFVLL